MSDESDDDLVYSDDELDSQWSADELDVFDINIEHDGTDHTATESFLKIEATSLSDEDLEERQRLSAENVSSLLGISVATAKSLLMGSKWRHDLLIERHMEDAAKIYHKHNVYYGSKDDNFQYIRAAPSGFKCGICMESADDQNGDILVASMQCGHSCCLSCYRSYLTMLITEDGRAADLTCPGLGCSLVLSEDFIRPLVTKETYRKYRTYITRDYVRDQEFLVWCPAPDCSYAIECHVRKADLNVCVPTVECRCGMKFCFGCSLKSHLPATCLIAQKWLDKESGGSETANWITANTRNCPNCSASIEKNGGCNHMTCRKCAHEFCWQCMDKWSLHGSSYFNCSRYDPKQHKTQVTNEEAARVKLERYSHYYDRYNNHLHSLNLDQKTLESVQKKMSDLQEAADMSWIEVQFLNQAYESLKQSRPALAWSYAFAYYLTSHNSTKIFEDNQQDLEMAVESLSELLEKPVEILAKSKLSLLDKIAYVEQRRTILTEYALRGISDNSWKYIDNEGLDV